VLFIIQPTGILRTLEKKELHDMPYIYRWLQAQEVSAPKEKTAANLISWQYHRFLDTFQKKSLEHIPTHKLWDHEINMKEGCKPKKGKVFPSLGKEREEIEAFLEDKLGKEYI